MKLLRFIRFLCISVIYVTVIGCLCSCSLQYDLGEVRDVHAAERKEIFSYVTEHKDSLIEVMDKVKSWSEKYFLLFNDGGLIMGEVVEWPYSHQIISNDAIQDFFNRYEILDSINFTPNSDIIVFHTGGVGMVTSSVEMGFYFSPQDKPAWVNSEQLQTCSLMTGQYMHYPMIQQDNGWVPDKSVLDPEKDSLLDDYGLYTERIGENFFYFESWY